MKRALVAFATLLLVGCLNEKDLIQKFAQKDDDELARQFINLLREEHYVEAEKLLERSARLQLKAGDLDRLHKIIDHGEPIAFEIIGANVGFFRPWDGSSSKRQSNLTYQLQFRDAWVVANLVIESSPDGRRILSAFFQPVPDSLQVLNRFTFKNKSALHYLFFTACILIPLFIVATITICVRSRVRRRWLWIIFILVGLGQFQLNWSTAGWTFHPGSFLLLGAAFFRTSSYAPVILSFAIPVGAIVFLACRSRLRRKDESPPPSSEPTSTQM